MVWKARIWLYPQYEIQLRIDLHAKKGPASLGLAASFCPWLEKAAVLPIIYTIYTVSLHVNHLVTKLINRPGLSDPRWDDHDLRGQI